MKAVLHDALRTVFRPALGGWMRSQVGVAPSRVLITPHEPSSPARCGACGETLPLVATATYPDMDHGIGSTHTDVVVCELCGGCERAALGVGRPIGLMLCRDSADLRASASDRQ
jgi:hypothetical protein